MKSIGSRIESSPLLNAIILFFLCVRLHKVDDVSFVLRKQTSTPKRAFRSDAIDLEVSLAERLREIDSTNTYGNHDRFQLFQDLFSQIIDRDVVFGQLLRK